MAKVAAPGLCLPLWGPEDRRVLKLGKGQTEPRCLEEVAIQPQASSLAALSNTGTGRKMLRGTLGLRPSSSEGVGVG